MGGSAVGRLERLRGSLKSGGPGARGLERVARNPACKRLRALTMIGVTPATAAAEVYREPAPEGQSPFALAMGHRFERALFKDDAAALVALYREAGRLRAGTVRVVVVPELARGGGPGDLDRRRAETDRLLALKLRGDLTAPHIIIKPRVAVGLLGVEHDTEPDALVAGDEDPFYRPVEVKSYPDRDGKTDPADLRGACRQAAVGVIALRHALARAGAGDPAALVPPAADLVLRAPGSLRGRLRPMTLKGEVASLERTLEEAPSSLEELEAMLPPGASLDDAAILDSVPSSYRGSCREHCALALLCRREAAGRGDPVLLGDAAREQLAPAGTLGRALELLHGTDPQPRSLAERRLADSLREAWVQYRQAVPHG